MILSKSLIVSTGGKLMVLALALSFYCRPAVGINMTYYSPGHGVDPAFGNFIEQFYTAAEGNTTTTADFVTFFTSNATIAMGPVQNFTGPNQIATFKETICSGDCVVNYHFPNVTTVSEETSGDKTFAVNGSAKMHYVNGSCGATSYETKFTILKDEAGRAELCPGSGSLAYLDLVAQSARSGSCDDF